MSTKLSALLSICFNYLFRNKIILTNSSTRTVSNGVNLHWWSIDADVQNVGDCLSPVITDFVKKRLNVDNSCKKKGRLHLFAIGSIIDGGYQDATIWGSGILRGNRTFWWRRIRNLDIRAVRGPETRRTLIANGYSCPEVFGDPAILLPLFYSPKSANKEYAYRVIPHHSFLQNQDNLLSPLTCNWEEFVDELVKCELVISSSLHGIILAEAYGVPAILLETTLDMFKFRDYYHSTGRYNFPIAGSVEEALQMKPAPLPLLDEMQKNLLESFPVDLWK